MAVRLDPSLADDLLVAPPVGVSPQGDEAPAEALLDDF
jgi:hypothetical protein